MKLVDPLLALMVASVASGAIAPQAAQPISYHLPAQITLHEPVILDLTVRNGLNEAMTIDFGVGGVSEFALDLLKPDGARVSARPTSNQTSRGARLV